MYISVIWKFNEPVSVGNNIIDASHDLTISVGNNIMYLFIVH